MIYILKHLPAPQNLLHVLWTAGGPLHFNSVAPTSTTITMHNRRTVVVTRFAEPILEMS